jgi:hypothetical protein
LRVHELPYLTGPGTAGARGAGTRILSGVGRSRGKRNCLPVGRRDRSAIGVLARR